MGIRFLHNKILKKGKVKLKGVNSCYNWNKPFDILYELGQSEDRGELMSNFRTFLRQTSIAPQIQQLSQLAA